jgi:hypothetical protein
MKILKDKFRKLMNGDKDNFGIMFSIDGYYRKIFEDNIDIFLKEMDKCEKRYEEKLRCKNADND